MALIDDDQEAGRKCVDELIEFVKLKEPLIDLLNTHPQFDGCRDNYWYYCKTTIESVGGVPYMKAYKEGRRDHELMQMLARRYSEEEFRALAVFFEKQGQQE
jgi:hypothetical protein